MTAIRSQRVRAATTDVSVARMRRRPVGPGELLRDEYLAPTATSAAAFAKRVGLPASTVRGILRGRGRVTARIAWALADALGTTPMFWTNAQTAVDLYDARPAWVRRRRAGRR